jgi:hypothetical protein
MKKKLLCLAGVLAVMAVVLIAVQMLLPATSIIIPIVGAPAVNPSFVIASKPTIVTITTIITDLRVISESVNLQQVDSTGAFLKIISPMRKDTANPIFFDAQFSINSPTPQTLFFRVSAGFRGMLQRINSKIVPITVTSLQEPSWSTYGAADGYSFKYPSNWVVSQLEDGGYAISTPNAPTEPTEGAELLITPYKNDSNLPIEHYFNGTAGPDFYTDTQQIMPISVGSINGMRFVGIPTDLTDETIVLPINTGFIVISSTAPPEVLQIFLSNFVFEELQ